MMDKALLYAILKNKSGAEISASGNPVTLSGTNGKPMKDLKVYGWSKQETTTGAQLWDAGDIEFKKVASAKIPLKAGKYTITADVESADTDSNFCLVCVGNVNISLPRGKGTSATFEITVDSTGFQLYASNNYVNSEEDIATFKNVMLNAGDKALPYEPYTGGQPSPNPEYPQEIESAGMKWSTGSQLYDMDTRLNVEGIEYEKNGTSYTVNIVKKSGNFLYGYPFQFSKEDVDATLSVSQFSNLEHANVRIDLLNSEGKTVGTLWADKTQKELSAKCSKIRFDWSDSGKFKISNLMLNFGSVALPYEPYTDGVPKLYGNKINLEVHGKNLFNITVESKCDKTGASSTKRIILPGEYIRGLTYTNICANYLNNVFISQERISFFTSGVGYGIGIGVIAEKGKKYVISGECKNGDTRMVFYDKSGGIMCNTDDNPFVVPENTKYAVLLLRKSKQTTDEVVFENIQVEEAISPTAYEPYHNPQSLSISTPTGLPAIPVDSGGNYTDANGQQWIADYIDLKRGKYVQNIRILELTGQEPYIVAGTSYFSGSSANMYIIASDMLEGGVAMCNYLSEKPYVWSIKSAVGCTTNIQQIHLRFSKATIGVTDDASLEETKTAYKNYIKGCYEEGNPIEIHYILADPIERDLTPSEIQAYQNLVTYAGTTIVENDADCYMAVSSGGGDALRAKKLALILGD